MSASVWQRSKDFQQCFLAESNLTIASLQSSLYMMEASPEDPNLVYENFEQDLNNETLSHLNEANSTYYTDYFWWKVILLVWDLIGLFINGLGIDMLWHGVEVNHAVYFVILQDICLAFGSALITETLNWFFWMDNLSWFRCHSFFSMMPFIFHNWAWASVAHLR